MVIKDYYEHRLLLSVVIFDNLLVFNVKIQPYQQFAYGCQLSVWGSNWTLGIRIGGMFAWFLSNRHGTEFSDNPNQTESNSELTLNKSQDFLLVWFGSV